jgi:hypothetical protein
MSYCPQDTLQPGACTTLRVTALPQGGNSGFTHQASLDGLLLTICSTCCCRYGVWPPHIMSRGLVHSPHGGTKYLSTERKSQTQSRALNNYSTNLSNAPQTGYKKTFTPVASNVSWISFRRGILKKK